MENYVIQTNGKDRFRVRYADGSFLINTDNGKIAIFGSISAAKHMAEFDSEIENAGKGEWVDLPNE